MDKPLLHETYVLKNKLDKEWCKLVESSYIEALKSVVKTFNRWNTVILNSFVYPYSNGYIEGVNNTTKVIKRISYGIKSFDRLRKKILWRQIIPEVSV